MIKPLRSSLPLCLQRILLNKISLVIFFSAIIFFVSAVHAQQNPPESPKNKSWISYTNAPGAFKVNMPGQPEPIIKDVPNPKKNGEPYTMNIFVAQDKTGNGVYLARYNDYPPGNYLANKNAVFDAMTKELATKGKLIGQSKTVRLDSSEGREFKMMLSDKYYAEVRMFARGNRIYLLLRQNLAENVIEPFKDDFFSSFRFTPYQEAKLFNFEAEGGFFSIKLPSLPLIKTDTVKDPTSFLKNTVSIYCTNPNSGGSYAIEYAQISEYLRIKDVDSLYKKMIKNMVSYTDTVIKLDTVNYGEKKGLKYIVQTKSTGIKQNKGLMIDNGRVYFLSTRITDDEQKCEAFKTFFSSLSIHKTATQPALSSSKANNILSGLLSADTIIFAGAKGALDYYNFNKDELPVVYQALNHNYTDDTLHNGTRSKLIEILKDVNDNQTVKNLQTIFANTAGKDVLQADILETIPAVDKKSGYDIYLKLLTKTPPLKLKYYYQLFNPLRDSVAYTAANFNSLLPLLKETGYRKGILQVTSNMLYDENKEIYYPLLRTNFGNLTKYANADLDKYISEKDSTYSEYLSPIYNYLRLMTKIKNQPFTDVFTSKIINAKPKMGTMPEAVIARIKNHLPINPAVLNTLMDSIANRYDVMQALYEEKQQLKIPLKYRKQDEFAKLCLYQYTEDDDDHPDKITLLGNVVSGAATYYAFKFTMPNREEEKSYLAIVGPIKPEPALLEFDVDNTYTAWEEKETNWQAKAKKLIPDLQKQLAANKAAKHAK